MHQEYLTLPIVISQYQSTYRRYPSTYTSVDGQNSWELRGVEMIFLRVILGKMTK